MSLTPKNWGTFQHYKDRSPAWIKLHRGLLDDYTFHRLPLASKALAPLLWLLASEYDNGAITADFDEIAFRFRMSLDDLQKAIKPLIDAAFFLASEPLADCKRDACLEKEEEREKEKEKEKEEKTDSRSVAKATQPREPDLFEKFWRAYPRRDGPNPRAPAEKKFNALAKSGVDPEMMIAAAVALAGSESAKGNVGTRFIPQAITWLNQQRWADHAAVAFLASEAGAELPSDYLEKAVAFFAKGGRWWRQGGPEPGSPGCRASAELLAKYGLAPDGRKLEPT
jgi:hypothetical protein